MAYLHIPQTGNGLLAKSKPKTLNPKTGILAAMQMYMANKQGTCGQVYSQLLLLTQHEQDTLPLPHLDLSA